MAKDDIPVHPLFGGRLEGDKKPKRARSGDASAGGKAAKAAKGDKPAEGRRRPKRKSVKKASGSHAGPPPGTVRIQKLLAEAGINSRRACEQLVGEGRVAVNGKTVKKLPCFVDPSRDEVAIDGDKFNIKPEKKVYILLNKPRGVVCTNSDAENRPRTIDLVAHVAQRVFPVGRLDTDSTGVIIMTNDGEFANRIAHPRYGVAKTYVVEVDGRVEGEAIEKLKAGMHLDGRRARAAGVKVLQRSKVRTLLEIRLNEGRNREIRRMLARLDYKVRSLRRVAIGPISDRGIKTGNCRLLRPDEVEKLIEASDPGR